MTDYKALYEQQLEENKKLKEQNDELEDEVLGCRDSYTLERESPYLRYKGEDYEDEDGDPLKPSDVINKEWFCEKIVEALGGEERFEPYEEDIKLRDILEKVLTYREQRDEFREDNQKLIQIIADVNNYIEESLDENFEGLATDLAEVTDFPELIQELVELANEGMEEYTKVSKENQELRKEVEERDKLLKKVLGDNGYMGRLLDERDKLMEVLGEISKEEYEITEENIIRDYGDESEQAKKYGFGMYNPEYVKALKEKQTEPSSDCSEEEEEPINSDDETQ
jgi:Asp-tRNA(Asn)/Glu-tRNA(Gln) amidotransferase C subunit